MVPDWKILDAIRWCIGDNGYSPTIRELCREVGVASPSSMKYRLDRLRDEGLITYDPRKSRTIRLTEKGEESCG